MDTLEVFLSVTVQEKKLLLRETCMRIFPTTNSLVRTKRRTLPVCSVVCCTLDTRSRLQFSAHR